MSIGKDQLSFAAEMVGRADRDEPDLMDDIERAKFLSCSLLLVKQNMYLLLSGKKVENRFPCPGLDATKLVIFETLMV